MKSGSGGDHTPRLGGNDIIKLPVMNSVLSCRIYTAIVRVTVIVATQTLAITKKKRIIQNYKAQPHYAQIRYGIIIPSSIPTLRFHIIKIEQTATKKKPPSRITCNEKKKKKRVFLIKKWGNKTDGM